MGNCQAIDAATLVIQHPCGKSDKLYWPVSAAEVMKTNPGHCVALLISSALCPTASDSASSAASAAGNRVRVTRIKLLRPPDILVLGQVYRLITTKEVMKVLSAKKHAKMMRQGQEIRVEQQQHETPKRNLPDIRRKDILVDKNDERQRRHQPTATSTSTSSSSSSRTPNHSATSGGKSRSWQPMLKSITEAV